MNVQERTLLVEFLDQLMAAEAVRKDQEAEALIQQACTRQPDACYLLAQRALQLEQALKIAQGELGRLQQERHGAPTGNGFMGSEQTWGRSPAVMARSSALVSAPPQRPDGARGLQADARFGDRFGAGALGNIAATAAGVMAGSFLFQGVQHLLGRRGSEMPWNAAAAPPGAPEPVALNDPGEDVPDGWDAGWDDGGDGGDFA